MYININDRYLTTQETPIDIKEKDAKTMKKSCDNSVMIGTVHRIHHERIRMKFLSSRAHDNESSYYFERLMGTMAHNVGISSKKV